MAFSSYQSYQKLLPVPLTYKCYTGSTLGSLIYEEVHSRREGKGSLQCSFILHNMSEMACGQLFFTGKEFCLGHTLIYKGGIFPKKKNATNLLN